MEKKQLQRFPKQENLFSEIIFWRVFQGITWCIGIVIFLLLLFFPQIGLHGFWNVLIPLAPLLFVLIPGVWRNICPMASTSLFFRHKNLSKRKRISRKQQAYFNNFGLFLLFFFIPIRHITMDKNALSTFIILAFLAILALIFGFLFEWKSGWCSGICPIHPVEKLYGISPMTTFTNSHCSSCQNCLFLCPDSTSRIQAFKKPKQKFSPIFSNLFIGFFPGFIIGWFYVPDYVGREGLDHLGIAFGLPFLGGIFSFSLYVIIKKILPKKSNLFLNQIFATFAISSYYWFRIPALVGFSPIPGDGMLIDLTKILPLWLPICSRIISTSFFFWWLVIRPNNGKSWSFRPAFAKSFSI